MLISGYLLDFDEAIFLLGLLDLDKDSPFIGGGADTGLEGVVLKETDLPGDAARLCEFSWRVEINFV